MTKFKSISDLIQRKQQKGNLMIRLIENENAITGSAEAVKLWKNEVFVFESESRRMCQ